MNVAREMWVLLGLAALTAVAIADMTTGSGLGGILIDFFDALLIEVG